MATETHGEHLLSPADVAEILSITRVHAWRLITSGELGPAIDISTAGSTRNQLRVTTQGLNAFRTRRQVATSSESNPTEGN